MADEFLTVDSLRESGQLKTQHMSFGSNLTDFLEDPTAVTIVPYWTRNAVWIEVPEGVFAGITRAGKYLGIWPPGFHWADPWTHLSWMVTQRTLVYRAPIRNCPTRDNIFISINVVLSFHFDGGFDKSVGCPSQGNEVDPIGRFYYRLGAESLEDRIQNALDEHLRVLALKVDAREAYDIRDLSDGPVDALKAGLAQHLGEFGIVVDTVTITSVILPAQIVADMQQQTIYSADNAFMERKHIFELREENNRNERMRLNQEMEQRRLAKTEDFQNMKSKVDKDIQILNADTEKLVAEIAAGERADVMAIKAEGDYEVAKLRMEITRILRELDATAKAESRAIKAQIDAFKQVEMAKGELVVTQNRAKALEKQAEAEASAADSLVSKRSFDIGMSRASVLLAMASNPHAIISNNHNTNNVASMAAVAGGNTSLILDVSKLNVAN